MFTADQIILHLIGDYFFQSDWMAVEKTKRWFPALLHGFVYSLPFLALLYSLGGAVIIPWLVICLSHSLIDRYRLVRYLIWALNRVQPKSYRHPWSECSGTGYHKDKPVWLAFWLMILVDNVTHIVINGLAIKFLT